MVNRAEILAMIDKAIEHALRPLKRRVLNMLVKGVLNVVYDRHLFEAQVTGLDDGEGNVDLFDGVEIFQDYGHGFHPLAGAEHLTAFLMGSRANGIILRIADRRYKLAGTREGEVWLNDDLGQKVHLTRDGIDIVTTKRHRVFCEDYELHASRSYLINVGGYADKLTLVSEGQLISETWHTPAVVTAQPDHGYAYPSEAP